MSVNDKHDKRPSTETEEQEKNPIGVYDRPKHPLLAQPKLIVLYILLLLVATIFLVWFALF